jgi:putative ABC transport system permease protein
VRTTQLIRFAVGGLWRQKVRTALTLVGVTVGTCALVFSLSLGMGLRAFIENEFKGREEFWRVTVRAADPVPDEATVPPHLIDVQGDLSADRKARLREALLEKHVGTGMLKSPAMLTPDKVAGIAALPDVSEVRTFRSTDGRVWMGEKASPAFVAAGNLSGVADRLVAGRLPAPDATEILLSEFALYELGLRSDAAMAAAVGKPVVLEVGGVRNSQPVSLARVLTGRLQTGELTRTQSAALEKMTAALPTALDSFGLTAAERASLRALLEAKPEVKERPWESGATARGEFAVAGVVRVTTRDERKRAGPLAAWELLRGDVLIPAGPGERLFTRLPWMTDYGFPTVEVRVRPGGDMPRVVADVEAQGFQTYSALKWFNNAKREVTLIAGGLNLFALVALLVAGIGITNTLVTSVVERTREIGILKAVGATRGQVQGMFLAEGAAIGMTGAVLGIASARLLVIPADAWVHSLIRKQMAGERMVTETIFTFPWWLWAGAVLFAVLVTTAAAYYPARRAARVHPIEALRYE